MGSLSSFLFARPSFLEGAGRLVDFGGFLNEYNYSPNGEEADNLALWADWTVVGNDIRAGWLDELMKERRKVGRSDVEKLQAP